MGRLSYSERFRCQRRPGRLATPSVESEGHGQRCVRGVGFVCNAGAGGAVTLVSDPTTCGAGDDTNIVGYLHRIRRQGMCLRDLAQGPRYAATVSGHPASTCGIWDFRRTRGSQNGFTCRSPCLHMTSSTTGTTHCHNRMCSNRGSNSLIIRANNAFSGTYTNIGSAGNGFLDKTQFTGGSRILRLGAKVTF